MTIPERDISTRAQGRAGSRRDRSAKWVALAVVAVLALAAAAGGPAAAASRPNIPGYNQAQVDRAITAVTKTTAALNKALHPGRKHGRRHR